MNECQHPRCFADLDTVFPLGGEGLRHSPATCLQCDLKTDCLRAAMRRPQSLAVREEMVERAYRGGLIGTIQRWSRKKAIHRMQRNMAKGV